MKKIIHVISSLESGGTERVLVRLITNSSNYKHYVVSLSKDGFYSPKLRKSKIKIFYLDFTNIKNTFSSIYKMKIIFDKIKPDIIQTWLYHADLIGGMVGKICGTRKIYWNIRGSYYTQLTSLRTRVIVKACSLLSYWIPDKIISNSRFARKIHIKIGYDKKKFITVFNGYETKKISKNNFFLTHLIKNKIKKNFTLFSMIARYDKHKDHENLFRALKIVKSKGYKFYLLLAGSNINDKNILLIKKIKKFNLVENIFLLGERKDIHKILPNIDINILSSVSESFPNVIAEAMIASVPCISTNVGDTKYIIGDTGWVVPPKNSLKLGKCIIHAILKKKNSEEWNIRKKNCYERIFDNLSLKKMIRSYENIWK